MTLPPTALVMIGSVAAAAISGFVAYVTLVRTKEQTIAEFRADWIKTLTADLAKLFSEIDLLLNLVKVEVVPAVEEGQLAKEVTPGPGDACAQKIRLTIAQLRTFRNAHREYYQQLNESYNLVKLRLDGKQHAHILVDLDKLYGEFYGDCANVDDIKELKDKVTNSSRELSEEIWRRIRQGDESYQRLRRNIIYFVAGSAIGTAIVYAAYYAREYITFESIPIP